MRLIIIRQDKPVAGGRGADLLQFALSGEPLGGVVLNGLCADFCRGRRGPRWLNRPAKSFRTSDVVCALPEEWGFRFYGKSPNVVSYVDNIPFSAETMHRARLSRWFVISNGRFATQMNCKLLDEVLGRLQTDALAVNVTPTLMAHSENVRLTANGKVAGFRRLYCDRAEPAPVPAWWPHHLFINTNTLEKLLPTHVLPDNFGAFVEACRSRGLVLQAVNVAGLTLDLATEGGLLAFCSAFLSSMALLPDSSRMIGRPDNTIAVAGECNVSPDASLFGPVLLGKDVSIGPDVVIVGPTIIADHAKIDCGAAIRSSLIGPNALIGANQVVRERIVPGPQFDWLCPTATYKSAGSERVPDRQLDFFRQHEEDAYRTWPVVSYSRLAKRIADAVIALVVLVLFAPIIPFVALAVKLNSPGPVFFRDKRQGLHGRQFNCIKFRTMTAGAHKIQDKLRAVSEVDGPQFKMADDPRISTVGRFLRETYIDEVPQFFNVLLGHMSTVGPRPSPESENTLCPSWRDARLSVRPGITGLWQVCRTRRPMKDFQEWIYYDAKYVRELSLKLDLWICWRTTIKMIHNFVRQF